MPSQRHETPRRGRAWHELLQRSEAKLLTAVENIAAGAVPLSPTTRRCPQSCDYFPLCRGDRFALERMVRVKGEE